MKKKPNLLIVGAAKSGTSSLYHYLKQHPEIFLPERKEPLYFIRHDVIDKLNPKDVAIKNENIVNKLPNTFNDYLGLFNSASKEKCLGECSATYLYYYKYSIPNIKKKLGNVKIIIILRDPVEKVFSQYKHLLRLGAETLTFEDSLKLERNRIMNNYSGLYHFKNQGLYYNQVKAFKDNFQYVLVLKTDDLKKSPQKVLHEITRFLEIGDDFEFDFSQKYNVSDFIPKIYWFHRFYNYPIISKIRKAAFFFNEKFKSKLRKIYMINNKNLVLSYKTRKMLRQYFKKDLKKLQSIVDFDISDWLNE